MERLLRVPVTDLRVVRVLCGKCKGVIELPLEQSTGKRFLTCPLCGIDLDRTEPGTSAVAELARAVLALQKQAGTVSVEFSLPAPEAAGRE